MGFSFRHAKVYIKALTHFTPLISWYPLKTSQNQRFSDVFRRYQKRSVAWNGFKQIALSRISMVETLILLYVVSEGLFGLYRIYSSFAKLFFKLSFHKLSFRCQLFLRKPLSKMFDRNLIRLLGFDKIAHESALTLSWWKSLSYRN